MSVLLNWIAANLRTTCLTLAGAFLVHLNLPCQPRILPSMTTADVLSPWEGMLSPLSEITGDLTVVATPRPFGLGGLSEACMVLGLPSQRMCVALSGVSTSSISTLIPELRYRFVPTQGYVMGLRARTEWMMIRGASDLISLSVDLGASMRIVEWTLAVGLDRVIDLGRVTGPTLRMGVARDLDTMAMSLDVIVAWDRPAALRLASMIVLRPNVPVRLALSTSPITVECALRMPVATTTDMLIDLRHSDPLGAVATLTLIMELP